MPSQGPPLQNNQGPVKIIMSYILYCHALGDRRRGIGLTIGFIAHNRTLKHDTTESLWTPSVFQLTIHYITATPQPL
jgi:hypothetical protein